MSYENIFTNKSDLVTYRKACRISAGILKELSEMIAPGVTPAEINKRAGELCEEQGVEPSFLDVPGPYGGFPGNLCVCVNDETLHAIPFSKRPFKEGDLVTIDFGVIYEGFFTDHSITKPVGSVSDEHQRLVDTAKLAVMTAIKQAKPGNRVGDISYVLGSISEMAGFTPIEGYAGHGIGKSIHQAPNIPYVGLRKTGPVLEEGMVFCIEVQISTGSGMLLLDPDGWTLRTEDGSMTAMHEHMVLITKKGPEILTTL